MPSYCICTWPQFIPLSQPLVEIYLLPGVFLGNNSPMGPRAAISVSAAAQSPRDPVPLSVVQVKSLSGHWLSWPSKDTWWSASP